MLDWDTTVADVLLTDIPDMRSEYHNVRVEELMAHAEPEEFDLRAVLESTINIFFKFKYGKIYDGALATPVEPNDVASGEIDRPFKI